MVDHKGGSRTGACRVPIGYVMIINAYPGARRTLFSAFETAKWTAALHYHCRDTKSKT